MSVISFSILFQMCAVKTVLLPDSCAGFDIAERFSQKLQHLYYQSLVHSCWLHRVWCCTAVWVMGACVCSLCVYCVQSYEKSLCLYWAMVRCCDDLCLFIYHCILKEKILWQVPQNFHISNIWIHLFNLENMNQSVCWHQKLSKIKEQDWSWVWKK